MTFLKRWKRMKAKRNLTGLFWSLVFLMSVAGISGCGRKAETASLPEETVIQDTGGAPIVLEMDGNPAASDVTKETLPAFETVDEAVYVNAGDVNLRDFASLKGGVIARLDKGTALKRTGYGDEWCRVLYQDREGYIATKYLTAGQPEEVEQPTTVPMKEGNGRLIAVDAGHQSKGNPEKEPDGPGSSTMKAKVASGTQGVSTGLPEYKLNLAVSLKLKKELEDRGYRVYMIRETNEVDISNAERAKMANDSGADLFVRVHANSLSDSSVHGTLTMCQTSKNPYNGNLYRQSSSLSKKVADGVSKATGFKNRGVQETDTMSGINWCTLPVTIVEMGFMSNAEEDKKMATEEYQEKIAKGIADGIDAYYAEEN